MFHGPLPHRNADDAMERRSPLKTLGALLVLGAVVVGLVEWLSAQEKTRQHPNPAAVMWLPFSAGVGARCIQGPGGVVSHDKIAAWDWVVAEGSRFVAAHAGRVVQVVDNRSLRGKNAFNNANRVIIDHGDGRYASYLHHQEHSALVRPMDLVSVGTALATVGDTGTTSPHLHLDVRGPSWNVMHDVAFHTADLPNQQVSCRLNNYVYRSVTGQVPLSPAFKDSLIQGGEFAINDITLQPGHPAFLLTADEERSYTGRVEGPAASVDFFLWQDGTTSEFHAQATPAADGSFVLRVRIPPSSRGARWYRITPTLEDGSRPSGGTLPAWVR